MGRWQQTFYLLRPLAIKMITLRGIAVVAILAWVLAIMLDPRPDSISSEASISETLNLDDQLQDNEALLEQTSNIFITWKKQTVASGDNLSTLFYRAGLNDLDVYRISQAQQGKSLRNLFPGEVLRFGLDSNGKLVEMRYEKTPLEAYIFSATQDRYQSRHLLREPEVLKSYREGTIKESLYLAGMAAKLPDKTVMELANIFGWDIDFVFDIRKGDSFAVLFEERYIDGQRLGTGNILAASFTNRGKTYKAVRYKNSQGQSSYFTPEGLSMRKAFLRTPLDIFRISSGFNLRRKHPIHKKIKAHRGVDYAAPTGTPVYASGDGRVIEAGYTKANGNFVFIQHGQTYTTKYIHLHRKKVRSGQSVKQRQIIGTVGATGYATGPHLHYEFLVNGVHRNPRTVSLPKANPIPDTERPRFTKMATALLEQLDQNQQATQLAINR
jgi:murein DD-endopeptidase MepM/ murein hydrolase activator NlpD